MRGSNAEASLADRTIGSEPAVEPAPARDRPTAATATYIGCDPQSAFYQEDHHTSALTCATEG